MPGMFDRLRSDLDARDKMAGLTPMDLLDLPDVERQIVQLLARHGELEISKILDATGLSEAELEEPLGSLAEKGFVLGREIEGRMQYRTYFGQRRRREVPINIWESLTEATSQEDEAPEDSSEAESDDAEGDSE